MCNYSVLESPFLCDKVKIEKFITATQSFWLFFFGRLEDLNP